MEVRRLDESSTVDLFAPKEIEVKVRCVPCACLTTFLDSKLWQVKSVWETRPIDVDAAIQRPSLNHPRATQNEHWRGSHHEGRVRVDACDGRL